MNTNELRDFFHAHWTVRKYKPFVMPSDHLDAIFAAAQRAPTDATAQMYSFIRLTDPELRNSIATLSGNPQIASASESFLVCADVYRLKCYLKLQNQELADIPAVATHFAIGDAALAGQNLLLAAEMLGYRGCWIGGVLNAMAEISKLTHLPEGVIPYAALTIGLPDEDFVHRPRLPRDQILHENHYREYSEKDLLTGAEQMNAISPRGTWLQLLTRYFAKAGSMESREPALTNYLRSNFFKK